MLTSLSEFSQRLEERGAHDARVTASGLFDRRETRTMDVFRRSSQVDTGVSKRDGHAISDHVELASNSSPAEQREKHPVAGSV